MLTSSGSRYVGYFSDGARSGMGFHEKDNDIFVGWYDDDQSQDFGIYYTNGGEERYLGEWNEGSFHGWGI